MTIVHVTAFYLQINKLSLLLPTVCRDNQVIVINVGIINAVTCDIVEFHHAAAGPTRYDHFLNLSRLSMVQVIFNKTFL